MDEQMKTAPEKNQYLINGISFEVPVVANVYGETDNQHAYPTFMIDYSSKPMSYSITVSKRPDISSTEGAANNAFQGATQYYSDENLPPEKTRHNFGSGWRCRKRFEDGFQTPFTIETVFLETKLGVVEIEYLANPDVFFHFLPDFNEFLDTLRAD